MSTIATPRTTYDAGLRVGSGRVFADAVRFEWTKLRTVRSTTWTLLAVVVAMIGTAVLVAEITVHEWATSTPADRLLFNPIEAGVGGVFFAQLAMGVLGVLVITTEYGTGMIRTTFAAVPQRGTLLAAKTAVLFTVTLIVGVLASFAGFLTAQIILGTYAETDLAAAITDAGALRGVVGAGLFLALMGLLGCAIGAVVRRSAGAITALFGLTFLLPGLLQLLPDVVKDNVTQFLPNAAGFAIYAQVERPHALSPGAGLVVLCAYLLAGLGIATVIMRRRDA